MKDSVERIWSHRAGENICKRKQWDLSFLWSKWCGPTPRAESAGDMGPLFCEGGPGHTYTLLDKLMASLEGLNEGPDKNSVFELCSRFKWPWEKHVLKPCCRLHTLDGEVKHWGNSTPQWFLCLPSAPKSDSPGSANRLAIWQQVIREMSKAHCAKVLLFSSAPWMFIHHRIIYSSWETEEDWQCSSPLMTSWFALYDHVQWSSIADINKNK